MQNGLLFNPRSGRISKSLRYSLATSDMAWYRLWSCKAVVNIWSIDDSYDKFTMNSIYNLNLYNWTYIYISKFMYNTIHTYLILSHNFPPNLYCVIWLLNFCLSFLWKSKMFDSAISISPLVTGGNPWNSGLLNWLWR